MKLLWKIIECIAVSLVVIGIIQFLIEKFS